MIESKKIHHVGFAVESIENSKAAFEIMGAKFFHSAYDSSRNLDFSFGELGGGVIIELISPHDPNLPCAVTKLIEKLPCQPYHICFKTDEFEKDLERLKKLGFKRIDKILTTNVFGYEAIGTFFSAKVQV